MSRSRWLVLLGPPLIVVAAAGALGIGLRPARVVAGALPGPRLAAACHAGPATEAGSRVRAAAGTWWRTAKVLDESGTLTGWRLTAGPSREGSTVRLDLPAASTASGPDRGRVIIAVDDGTRSSITILDVAGGCDRVIDLGPAIARRAIADPAGDGVLVHLLARATRADLGVWLVAPSGRRTLVLGPADRPMLVDAGIDRVWATGLAVIRGGNLLAVQSCDPEACVTRVLDRASGLVTTLRGEQGDVLGFAGDALVTMAACHGLPCGVLAWSTAVGAAGTATEIATSTLGAAVGVDGSVVVAVPASDSATRVVAVDATGRSRHDLGDLAADTLPLPATSLVAGIEAGPNAIALIDGSGLPSVLEVK